MKKRSVIILLTVAMTSCQDFTEVPSDTTEDNSASTRAADSDGQDYYWYQGEKIHLTRNNDFVNVVVDGKLKKSSKSEMASLSANTSKETTKYAMPFFERGEGIEPIGTSDIFHLKLKSLEDVDMLKKMAAELGVQVIEEIPYTPLWYTLSILGSDFSSSIEASNHFYETGKFEEVDPAFMFDFKPSVDDPEFWRQWGMVSSSSYDINVVPAWAITRGAGVKVAVVDTPIQSNHTDLNDNMHSLSYNAYLKQTPSAPYDPNYYPSYLINTANHGTRVAGIIAAEKNGSMVTGVAYESRIVRVSHYLSATNTSASELASGINWAWKATSAGGAGVDVINCSWGDQGGRAYGQLHSSVLESAIRDAMTQGRGGKGCVVVFASGNVGDTNPGRIDYPGSFHSNILVVGSIDESGSKSYFSSYGSQLDVMAPGNSIWSTIYNDTTGYDSGTSFAAPHVSGIAALILSVYPTLTQTQVANMITKTASNSSWNSQTGYGLVNAYKALISTLPTSIHVPMTIDCVNTTATLPELPSFVTGITWRGSSGIEIVSGQGTRTVTFRKKSLSNETSSALYADFHLSGGNVITIGSTSMSSASWSLTDIYAEGSGRQYSLTANPYSSVPQYEWRTSSGYFVNGTGPGIVGYNYVEFADAGSHYVEVRVNNRCGAGSWVGLTITVP